MKSLFVRSLLGETIERPPVWMMRQAGRYLEEYKALKEDYDFMTLCKTPELAVEVALQPIRALDPDAAIIFGDILIPGEAMGFSMEFSPGPKIQNPIRGKSDILNLKCNSPHTHTRHIFDAISLLKRELDALFPSGPPKAVLGFAGAPWTLACYFLDQGPYKHFQGTQICAAQDPSSITLLLERLSDFITEYLLGQFESGADAVQLFDTWAGILSEEDYRVFALPYVQRIIEGLRRAGCPTIYYANNASHLLGALNESGADCISLDWRTSLSSAEEIIGSETALQGNLNPAFLFGSFECVQERTREMLNSLRRRTRYIANLGHGVLQTTPRDNARMFIETVKEGWSAND